MATTAQIQSCFFESEYELRTPLNHHIQLQSLTGPSHSANSTEYGINRRSILDDIPHFSVVGNLPHDIMHDIFEGVVQCELKLLLAHLVSVKHFTIDVLNDRLRRFDFGYSELSDKPSELDEKVIKSADQKIRQSAAKMWSLPVFLPLLVGDLVPEKCEAWDFFILLLKICSIAVSWKIEPENIPYLSKKIMLNFENCIQKSPLYQRCIICYITFDKYLYMAL